jgi:cardiolipin synthase
MNLIDILIGREANLSFPWFALAHFVLVILFGFRLIWYRRPVSVSFAWFLVVMILPVFGILFYAMFGERPVGRSLTKKIVRMEREHAKLRASMCQHYAADRLLLPIEASALSLLAEAKNGSPVTAGNRIELYTESLTILQTFVREIDEAKVSLHMEFYIWALGGDADAVGEAVIRAAKRGVSCRVLLDSLGSKAWFKSAWPNRFKDAGIAVTEALPIQLGRFQFRRADLRLHRKIFVIDGHIVWTGSMNLVDPP